MCSSRRFRVQDERAQKPTQPNPLVLVETRPKTFQPGRKEGAGGRRPFQAQCCRWKQKGSLIFWCLANAAIDSRTHPEIDEQKKTKQRCRVDRPPSVASRRRQRGRRRRLALTQSLRVQGRPVRRSVAENDVMEDHDVPSRGAPRDRRRDATSDPPRPFVSENENGKQTGLPSRSPFVLLFKRNDADGVG